MNMANVSLLPNLAGPTAAWVPTPNTRGTFDIIWSCAQTTALCAWVSICVNVPAPDHGNLDLLRDKFHFILLTLLGPELVFMLAFFQFQSAQASVKQFRDEGYTNWSLSHAFYADMGGIHVQHRAWKRFPVNAKQLHYLVTHGHLPFPELALSEIKARGKTDTLARIITIGQTLYFLVTTLARAAQGLAITTLELTVVGFIFCSLANSICWWYKPNDVELSHVFELSNSIDDILKQAGEDASEVYRNTPLDFASREEWIGYNLWNYYVNILRQIGLFPDKHKDRPIQRISSFNFPRPKSHMSEVIVLWVGLAYTGTFFGAWNFYFPSTPERVLWRVFSASQCSLCLTVALFEMYYLVTPSTTRRPATLTSQDLNFDTEREGHTEKPRLVDTMRRFWSMPFNNSIGRYSSLDVPLRSLLVTTPLCAAYCICRWYLLFEDVIGLRSVPSSAYLTVDWTRYWPSF